MTATTPQLWECLDPEDRLRLQVEYGYYSDSLPPTCSLALKGERFARWLAERGVVYTPRHDARQGPFDLRD
ncbi:MAG: hypothetical protein ACFCUJ_16735 [Thiotrichales bacterium]